LSWLKLGNIKQRQLPHRNIALTTTMITKVTFWLYRQQQQPPQHRKNNNNRPNFCVRVETN
ncbi:hypothetical protein MEO94_19505, partial [Dolichospermum sp. ST_sed9]|nr:hypothetical protein [Dolichospermum sp. ST_sed9]